MKLFSLMLTLFWSNVCSVNTICLQGWNQQPSHYSTNVTTQCGRAFSQTQVSTLFPTPASPSEPASPRPSPHPPLGVAASGAAPSAPKTPPESSPASPATAAPASSNAPAAAPRRRPPSPSSPSTAPEASISSTSAWSTVTTSLSWWFRRVAPATTAPPRGASETSTARVRRSLGLWAWMGNRAWRARARATRSGYRSIAAAARITHPTLASLRLTRRCSRERAHARTATHTTTRRVRLRALLRIIPSLFVLRLIPATG